LLGAWSVTKFFFEFAVSPFILTGKGVTTLSTQGKIPSGTPAEEQGTRREPNHWIKRVKEYALTLIAGSLIDVVVEHISPESIKNLQDLNQSFLTAVKHVNAFGLIHLWYENFGAEAYKSTSRGVPGGWGDVITSFIDTIQQMFSQGLVSIIVLLLTLGFGVWVFINLEIKSENWLVYLLGVPFAGSLIMGLILLFLLAIGTIFGGILAASQLVAALSFTVPVTKAILEVHAHEVEEAIIHRHK
jgi:hypothetical protein